MKNRISLTNNKSRTLLQPVVVRSNFLNFETNGRVETKKTADEILILTNLNSQLSKMTL